MTGGLLSLYSSGKQQNDSWSINTEKYNIINSFYKSWKFQFLLSDTMTTETQTLCRKMHLVPSGIVQIMRVESRNIGKCEEKGNVGPSKY